MHYMYDQILNSKKETIVYLEKEYTLVSRNTMGNFVYYSYKGDSSEDMIIVVPKFAEEFLEAAKKYMNIKNCASNETVMIRLKKTYKNNPEMDKMIISGEELYIYSVQYKDIRLSFQLENEKFTLQPSFTILNNNIFGNNISVDISENPELRKYCDLK